MRCPSMFSRLVLLATALALPAAAEEALTVERALAIAAEHNPSLNAARTEAKKASEQVAAEELRFPWLLSVRASPAITQTPSLNSIGTTNSNYAESFNLSGALTKPFSQGTELSLELLASADRRLSPVLVTGEQDVWLGPGYGLQARIGLRHPLLRGGRDVAQNAMRSARLRRTSVDASRDRQASELGRDVLMAYWELWYAQQALDIDEASLELARRTLADAQARIEEGALAAVEAYSFEIRVATLEESLAASRVERDRRTLELRRLLGGHEGAVVASEAPRDFPLPDDLPKLALEASPQLLELEAEVELARNGVIVAHDATRARLDLEASLSARGLGNQQVWPAVDGVLGTDGLSGSLSVIYEMPLQRGAARGDEAVARLGVETAQWRLASLEQQLSAEVKTQLERHQVARDRIRLASRTLELSEKLAVAERERLEAGAAIPLQVLEAESNLRDARLRLARARADLTGAQLSLLHLSGELLARVGQ